MSLDSGHVIEIASRGSVQQRDELPGDELRGAHHPGVYLAGAAGSPDGPDLNGRQRDAMQEAHVDLNPRLVAKRGPIAEEERPAGVFGG